MTDDVVKRWDDYVESMGSVMGDVEHMAQQMRQRIEQLTAERYEAINQLDSAIHSQIVLEKRTAAVMEDRKLILEERDRTFALMLARAEKAEADNARLRADLTVISQFQATTSGAANVHAIWKMTEHARAALNTGKDSE
jgi:hypothetical protein